ncbi:ent-kaur-16-ene synthase, chloroplastic-like [Pistacia vera]|uniref:ent-kaur-16-ene synthase, chloroplastic-like n=1 Tax=Pistacia vera TaxID=55513 RepID=UPI001263CC37|nr:ent-kaur-16-ene synthase, chloroplastic-like [Pistacia vera]
MARCMIVEKKLSKMFWAEVVNTGVYILNRLLTKAIKNQTPFEAWSGVKPVVSNLKVFRSICYAMVPADKRTKLDEKSRSMNLYKEDKKIDEEFIPQQPTEDLTDKAETEEDEEFLVRGTRTLADVYARSNMVVLEPGNDTEAARSEARRNAMQEELSMIEKNNTWELVDRPRNRKVIRVKWIFKKKLNPDGSVHKYKARLMVKGFAQQQGVDFSDTFASEARHDTIRRFLGMEIDQSSDGIFVCQERYANEVLKKFGMENCKPVDTILVPNMKLSKDDSAMRVDEGFMSNQSELHLRAAKKVLRYVKGNTMFGIWFKKSENLELLGYTNSDRGGSLDDMKSTSGYVFYINLGTICWLSKKQETVAQSTVEAEYISTAVTVNQAIWLKKILIDLKQNQGSPTLILCDNQSAVAMAKNPILHDRTKHINTKFHVVREAQYNGEVSLIHCRGENQNADIMTKALSKAKTEAFLGIEKIYEKGVSDYLSVSLWCDYLRFGQECDPSIREFSPDGIAKARNLFEHAITATGLHVAEGNVVGLFAGMNYSSKRALVDYTVKKLCLPIFRLYIRIAYVSEGMGKLQDWEMVMKFQRKNGSPFNSPSTTAAAVSHLQDASCLHYLRSVLEKFGDAVPTVYPFDFYARLFMVESLESLGIDQHFKNEIRRVLDETYRCWLQGEEEILLDPATCAMAFRLLRVNGYNVSSDPLTKFSEEDQFFRSLGGYLNDLSAVLELYKASQIMIHPDELILEKQNLWTRRFLGQKLSSGSVHSDRLGKHVSKQVEYALKFPYHLQLDRVAHRRSMENYSVDGTRILKTSYRSLNIGNKYFQKLAVDEINICQLIYREELEHLERWVVENRLDRLKFARQKMPYSFFCGAATLFSPELSDARISWAKNIVLTFVVDDFFDVEGSIEELVNLVELVEKWNLEEDIKFCSEEYKCIISVLKNLYCEMEDKGFTWQGRDLTTHVAEIWLNLLKSQLKEAEWLRNKSLPTVDEYIENACVTYALGPIVFPTMYLVGPKLPEELVTHPEFHKLYKLASICGRLLNDIQSLKRECKEETLNAVSLQTIHSKGVIAEEEAIENLRSVVNSSRRELLRLVLQEKGSIIPRPIKDLFLKTSKSSHLFYMEDDGFTSDSMMNFVNDLIQEQLCVNKL